jgi:hypothetical protein
MKPIRLAYRDHDRTPVIYCIKEMARRHYGLAVEPVRIAGAEEYEAALFDGACEVIIERLEYLYAEAAKGRKITMFCAPVLATGLDLVVPPHVSNIADLKGKTIAVRGSGRPHSITIRLRKMGLEESTQRVIVNDNEVGRWGQWKKVESGECIACFMSPLYIEPALAAGLKVLPTPDADIVGHFSQACLTPFANDPDGQFGLYVRAVIHALCLMKLNPRETMAIVSQEPMRLMKITDPRELVRQVQAITKELRVKPYPTVEAVAHHHEIAGIEWPGAKALGNPLTLWDLHWIKELDEEGFIDDLAGRMTA